MEDVYLGIDIGKSKIAVGLIRNDGIILEKKQISIDISKGARYIINTTISLAKKLLYESNVNTIAGIGIGTTGVVDHKKGIAVSSGSIPGWKNIPLKDIFEKEFKVPTLVDNDVVVAALGEYHYGNHGKHDTMIYLTISSGIGFCSIIESRVWRGKHGLAGQIAHLPLFDSKYTVNELASGRGIAHQASKIFRKEITTAEVFKLANRGDINAKEIVNRAINVISLIIAWLQNTIDPQLFVLGGSVIINNSSYIDVISKRATEYLYKYRHRLDSVNISLSTLKDNAVLIGSVALFKSI